MRLGRTRWPRSQFYAQPRSGRAMCLTIKSCCKAPLRRPRALLSKPGESMPVDINMCACSSRTKRNKMHNKTLLDRQHEELHKPHRKKTETHWRVRFGERISQNTLFVEPLSFTAQGGSLPLIGPICHSVSRSAFVHIEETQGSNQTQWHRQEHRGCLQRGTQTRRVERETKGHGQTEKEAHTRTYRRNTNVR